MSNVVCEVSAGDFSLGGAPRSGRPVEVDSNQIKTLIENNQRYTTQQIANILKISKPMKLLVKMKNVSILQNKLNGLFGQPSASLRTSEAGAHMLAPSRTRYLSFSEGL